MTIQNLQETTEQAERLQALAAKLHNAQDWVLVCRDTDGYINFTNETVSHADAVWLLHLGITFVTDHQRQAPTED